MCLQLKRRSEAYEYLPTEKMKKKNKKVNKRVTKLFSAITSENLQIFFANPGERPLAELLHPTGQVDQDAALADGHIGVHFLGVKVGGDAVAVPW